MFVYSFDRSLRGRNGAGVIYRSVSGITIKQNILFSQSLIFVPTVLYLFIMRKHVKDIIWFRRFHPLTLLLIPPLVLFMEPLITLLNAISMLFVRNEISNAASALVDHNTLGTSLFSWHFCRV